MKTHPGMPESSLSAASRRPRQATGNFTKLKLDALRGIVDTRTPWRLATAQTWESSSSLARPRVRTGAPSTDKTSRGEESPRSVHGRPSSARVRPRRKPLLGVIPEHVIEFASSQRDGFSNCSICLSGVDGSSHADLRSLSRAGSYCPCTLPARPCRTRSPRYRSHPRPR